MSIDTNKLSIKFNIEEIKKDFVFIRLNKKDDNNKYIGASQIGALLGEDFKAVATLFISNAYAYVMFKRTSDTSFSLLEKIRSSNFFKDDTAVSEVIPVDDQSNVDGDIRGAWLAQILINSLSSNSNSKYKQFHFCNLTGSFLLVPNYKSKKQHIIDVVKVSIAPNTYLLLIEVVRHRLLKDVKDELNRKLTSKRRKAIQNALKKPRYRFEESTGTLITYFNQIDSEDKANAKSIYIECGLEGKKASLPFLEFGSLANFEQSKSGIFYGILNLIKENLSKYMTIELSQRDIDTKCELDTSFIKDIKKVNKLLSNHKFHIVETENTQESKFAVTNLKNALIDTYEIPCNKITIGGKDKSDSLNFRIIHEKSFYLIGEDKYLSSNEKFTRQNLTIESLSANGRVDSIITTGIKELLIKQDINNLKFSLFQWSDLNLLGTWTFAVWDKEKENVVFMEICDDGEFKFYNYKDCDLLNWEKFDRYKSAFSIDKNDKNSYLEGIVVSNNDDINQIFRTQEITIPNLEEIHSILYEIDSPLPENISTGSSLSKIVRQCLKTYSSMVSKEKFEALIDFLEDIGYQIIKKQDFYKLLRDNLGGTNGRANTKDAKQLMKYMLHEHKIRFILTKDKETIEELFNSSIDIKYFGETEQEAYYFVGNSKASIQSSFKDSCHLRKIVAVGKDSKLVFSQLLPTMDVDFVRTGQSTVIPFPFKYIREYIEMNKTDK